MRARRAPTISSRRTSRFVHVVLAVARVLLVLGAFELSGAAPVVAEVVAYGAVEDASCCSDCPLEKDGRECPPGCPSCHCSHGAASLPPVFERRSQPVVAVVGTTCAVPYEATAPRAPSLRSVYRPPRHAAVSL